MHRYATERKHALQPVDKTVLNGQIYWALCANMDPGSHRSTLRKVVIKRGLDVKRGTPPAACRRYHSCILTLVLHDGPNLIDRVISSRSLPNGLWHRRDK